jgi:amicyanin
MKNQTTWTIAMIAVVVIAVIAGYFLMNQKAAPVAPVVPPQTPTGPQTVNVEISNFAFNPASLTIKAGDTVVWTNKDSVKHLLTNANATGTIGISSPALSNGDTYSKTFDKAGTYAYMCQIHPSMKGVIIVE